MARGHAGCSARQFSGAAELARGDRLARGLRHVAAHVAGRLAVRVAERRLDSPDVVLRPTGDPGVGGREKLERGREPDIGDRRRVPAADEAGVRAPERGVDVEDPRQRVLRGLARRLLQLVGCVRGRDLARIARRTRAADRSRAPSAGRRCSACRSSPRRPSRASSGRTGTGRHGPRASRGTSSRRSSRRGRPSAARPSRSSASARAGTSTGTPRSWVWPQTFSSSTGIPAARTKTRTDMLFTLGGSMFSFMAMTCPPPDR